MNDDCEDCWERSSDRVADAKLVIARWEEHFDADALAALRRMNLPCIIISMRDAAICSFIPFVFMASR